MTESNARVSSALPAGSSSHASGQHARWSRLCLKELRETLRDRRTLITLIMMPLLVYPVLSMVFQRSMIAASSSGRPRVIVGVRTEEQAEWLRSTLAAGDQYRRRRSGGDQRNDPKSGPATGPVRGPASGLMAVTGRGVELSDLQYVASDDLSQALRAENIDIGVRRGEAGRVELVYRGGSSLSQRALQFIEDRLQAVNEWSLRERLRQAGQDNRLPLQPRRQLVRVPTTDTTLGTVVPMILILMTLTGAVYPAIDLTAGERERGTLEMLMASPVPRLKLLLAKYVAVVTVACLTALVNLVAMTVTLQVTGLSSVLFGDGGLSALRVAQILGLLVMFAAFFSAVLLALTSFARSFKEAQAYLIPLMLLSLGPGIVSLLPGLQLRGLLAITPISNMVLLARDLCGQGANPLMAAVAIVSTGLYTLAAIAIAARIFGTDAVLSGGQLGWSDVLQGDGTQREVPSVPGALFCLAVLFPIYFVVANGLGQLRGVPLPIRLVASGVATSLLFGVIPWVATRIQQLRAREVFQWQPAPWLGFVVAIGLGVTLWPLAHEVFFLNQLLGLVSIRPEQLEAVQNLLKEWRHISPAWILLSMALAPAVFEELFFRGYLFSALRAATSSRSKSGFGGRASGVTTVVVSAVLFGLFHVVSTSALSLERFLPSTFLGLVLGFVCFQTRSVLPGMVLHACHNGLLLMIAYYRDELKDHGWGVEEESHLPWTWIAISASSLVVGVVILSVLPRWFQRLMVETQFD